MHIFSFSKVCKDEKNRKISTRSPESTEGENQSQTQLESSDDTNIPTGDISPDTNKISYEKAPQNQAQNNPSVDIMDTGDIIPTSSKHSYDNIIATVDEDKFQKQNVQTIYRVDHTDNFACNNCKMI